MSIFHSDKLKTSFSIQSFYQTSKHKELKLKHSFCREKKIKSNKSAVHRGMMRDNRECKSPAQFFSVLFSSSLFSCSEKSSVTSSSSQSSSHCCVTSFPSSLSSHSIRKKKCSDCNFVLRYHIKY